MSNGEEIVRARFFIEPKEEHNRVQHIGCRLAITEQMLHAGFTKGMVFNLHDGTVEVALEGKRKDIEAFHADVRDHLVSWLESRATNKDYLKMMLGNPGLVVSDIEYKPTLRMLDIGLFSHSLELNQLEKGVDVYYELIAAIRGLKDTTKEVTSELSETTKGLRRVMEQKL
ncbi:MAG: acylphosphatase [Candidatus Micrarchaeota archaeon]